MTDRVRDSGDEWKVLYDEALQDVREAQKGGVRYATDFCDTALRVPNGQQEGVIYHAPYDADNPNSGVPADEVPLGNIRLLMAIPGVRRPLHGSQTPIEGGFWALAPVTSDQLRVLMESTALRPDIRIPLHGEVTRNTGKLPDITLKGRSIKDIVRYLNDKYERATVDKPLVALSKSRVARKVFPGLEDEMAALMEGNVHFNFTDIYGQEHRVPMEPVDDPAVVERVVAESKELGKVLAEKDSDRNPAIDAFAQALRKGQGK